MLGHSPGCRRWPRVPCLPDRTADELSELADAVLCADGPLRTWQLVAGTGAPAFPYAVFMGLLFLDKDARADRTPKRRSTYHNAFRACGCSPAVATRSAKTNGSSGCTFCLSTPAP